MVWGGGEILFLDQLRKLEKAGGLGGVDRLAEARLVLVLV